MKYDKEKFSEWINKQWQGEKKCPICQKTLWTLGDHIIESRAYNNSTRLVIGGPTYPSIPLICATCGHTLFFNAIVCDALKIVKPHSESLAEVAPNIIEKSEEGQS